MTEIIPDLHHKMCKKVAQLTKVIFYLNTKNDDYERSLSATVSSYEQALDANIKDANLIITKYKEQVDKLQKNEQSEQEILKLKQSLEYEKS